jgi:5-methylcytosine-specific restriction endonuclease McrA
VRSVSGSMTRTTSELKRHLFSDDIRRFREMRGERTLLKHRDSYYVLSYTKPKVNEQGQKLCLSCGKLIEGRRRKYCSDECATKYFREHYWSVMKNHILNVQNFTCQSCGATPPRDSSGHLIWTKDHSSRDYFDYVVDHKTPIALGGEEFDETNLQVLCGICNKIKTKIDMKKIVKIRRETKLIHLNNNFDIEGLPNLFHESMFVSLDQFLQISLVGDKKE